MVVLFLTNTPDRGASPCKSNVANPGSGQPRRAAVPRRLRGGGAAISPSDISPSDDSGAVGEANEQLGRCECTWSIQNRADLLSVEIFSS